MFLLSSLISFKFLKNFVSSTRRQQPFRQTIKFKKTNQGIQIRPANCGAQTGTESNAWNRGRSWACFGEQADLAGGE
jgi:hypothetical protein